MLNRTARITIGLLLTILLVLVSIVVYVRTQRAADEKNVADESLFNDSAKEAYRSITGGEIELDEYEEKPLVVTAWASWCPQCADELGLIDRSVGELGQGKVRVLAVNRNEPREQAQRFLSTLPSFPNITFVLDQQDHFFDSVGGYAMPETIFYNAAGEIMFHKRGNLTVDDIKAGLEAVLTDE